MVLYVIEILVYKAAFAAACCAGGASQVSIMAGDLRSQFKVAYSNAAVTADVDAKSNVSGRDGSTNEITETFDLQYNYRFSDLWQLGGSIPLVVKTKEASNLKEDTKALGDISLQISYEFLPELEYSEWKPKGFLYSYIKIPVARSVYDSEKPLQSDAIGKGFYQLAVGSFFIKRFKALETFIAPSLIYSKPQGYEILGHSREVQPGLKTSLQYGATYFMVNQPLQVSVFHTINYNEKTKILGLGGAKDSYYQEVLVSLGYDWKTYNLNAFYSNQEILGPAKNTSLETSIGIQLTSAYEL